MSQTNYAKVGFFVLAAVALTLVVIGVAGARVFRQRVVLAETYFEESITGLDLGAPVKYRGVPVGEVKRIGFVQNEYCLPQGECLDERLARQIVVVMALEPEKFGLLGASTPAGAIQGLVAQGLRVKLSMSGVTGLAFLELDYLRPGKSEQSADETPWTPRNPFIPASASTMATIKQAIDDIYLKLDRVDLPALGLELIETLALLRRKMEQLDVARLSVEGGSLLRELRETNAAVRQLVASPELETLPLDLAATISTARRVAEAVEPRAHELGAAATNLAARAAEVLETAGAALDATEALISGSSENLTDTVAALRRSAQTLNRAALSQQGAVEETLDGLRRAADSLDRLVSELGDNPAALLFGRPPEPLPRKR